MSITSASGKFLAFWPRRLACAMRACVRHAQLGHCYHHRSVFLSFFLSFSLSLFFFLLRFLLLTHFGESPMCEIIFHPIFWRATRSPWSIFYIFLLVGSEQGGILKISFLGPPEVGEKQRTEKNGLISLQTPPRQHKTQVQRRSLGSKHFTKNLLHRITKFGIYVGFYVTAVSSICKSIVSFIRTRTSTASLLAPFHCPFLRNKVLQWVVHAMVATFLWMKTTTGAKKCPQKHCSGLTS